MLDHLAYGHIRIADELKVSGKRVRRVMKLYGLKPARRSRTRRTQDSRRTQARYLEQVITRSAEHRLGCRLYLLLASQPTRLACGSHGPLHTEGAW